GAASGTGGRVALHVVKLASALETSMSFAEFVSIDHPKPQKFRRYAGQNPADALGKQSRT
ncbi:MAG TPA: hypothetical protein PK112_08550, partial [candidate division Zixibacteria bacterium]|nr:hypothetical protein [candidate division Zixibacteria bacterium]